MKSMNFLPIFKKISLIFIKKICCECGRVSVAWYGNKGLGATSLATGLKSCRWSGLVVAHAGKVPES